MDATASPAGWTSGDQKLWLDLFLKIHSRCQLDNIRIRLSLLYSQFQMYFISAPLEDLPEVRTVLEILYRAGLEKNCLVRAFCIDESKLPLLCYRAIGNALHDPKRPRVRPSGV
jgi:hypothetical protein